MLTDGDLDLSLIHIFVKKKKQRKLQEEEESLADEFDRLTEDE